MTPHIGGKNGLKKMCLMSVESEQKCFNKVGVFEARVGSTLGEMTLKTHKG